MPTSLLFPNSYHFGPQGHYQFRIAGNYSVADANIPPIDNCCPAAAAAAAERRDFGFEKTKYLKQLGGFVCILEDAISTRQYDEEKTHWQL